ncbi:cysteine--tRNA ligase, partial [Candidatus Saccharibacteria bacterium]|nr:cysteine--tRNA ligase [Candidatus Saccharibacteria bacterium]
SVMAREILGDQIDIHTGGIDHIPVHHTNEIAQTEAVTGKPFANNWLHNNHLKVNGTKIAKSLGNGFTLQDIENKGLSIQAFKLMVISKHYRTEGNFTWEILEAAQNRLNRWQALADLVWQVDQSSQDLDKSLILEKLQDDLDTPAVLAIIDAHFDEVEKDNKAPTKKTLATINELLGIDLVMPDIDKTVSDLLADRQQARDNQDWEEADRLRQKLLDMDIVVKDTPVGQLWSRL